MKTILLLTSVFALSCRLVLGADETEFKPVQPSKGTYKDAFRKAGQDGKLVMLAFYNDSYVDCSRVHAHLMQIPRTMDRFVYFVIKTDGSMPVARQYSIEYYPTLLFLKPDGTEVGRQTSMQSGVERQANLLQEWVDAAGPIAKGQKQREAPSDKTTKGAAERAAFEKAASNDLRAAMNQLTVGRKKEAAKAFQQIVTKYPGSEAANLAQEQLDQLAP